MKYYLKISKNFICKVNPFINEFNIKGPLGVISLKYNNNFFSIVTENLFFIKKNFIKTFFSFLKNSYIGLNFGFYNKLEVFGLGYKIINERSDLNKLCLDLGCTHWIFYNLGPSIFSIVKDKVIFLYSTNLSILNTHASQIRQLRYLTPYKPKGIKYFDEVLVVKQTKQK